MLHGHGVDYVETGERLRSVHGGRGRGRDRGEWKGEEWGEKERVTWVGPVR
jgi:hypothetical protein